MRNCAIFCPHEGAPYKEKLTLFWNEEDFNDSDNSGFLLVKDGDNPEFLVEWTAKLKKLGSNQMVQHHLKLNQLF